MKTFTRAALTALLLGSAGVAVPAVAKDKPAAAPKVTLSKPVLVALQAAQKAQQAGDIATATAQAQAAEAAKATADDALAIGQVKINIGLTSKNNDMIAEGLQEALSSGKVAEADVPKYYRNLGAIALQKNDYASAIRAYEQLEKVNPADGETAINLAEMYQRTKQTPQAIAAFDRAIAAKRAAGQPVPEAWYKREFAIAYDARMPAQTASASMALLTAYPSPTNWRDALVVFSENNKLDDQTNLDRLRLQRAASALAGERDYFEYADTAAQRGLSAESKAVLDEGVAKGALTKTKPYVAELIKVVTPKAAAGRAGLARDASIAKTGKDLAGAGDGYLSYGDYAKAAPLYKSAIAKGGVDTATVNTRLGIALAMSGDKAGATAAFQAVKGGPRETLAQFWLAYLAGKA